MAQVKEDLGLTVEYKIKVKRFLGLNDKGEKMYGDWEQVQIKDGEVDKI